MVNPNMVFTIVVLTVCVHSRTVPVEYLYINKKKKHSLPAAVTDAIKPVFKCRACEKNHDEHGNSVIWTRMPKTFCEAWHTQVCGIQCSIMF